MNFFTAARDPFVRAFFAARAGSTATIFGISIIAIFGIAGAALDYGRALRLETRLQAAVDSAFLAGARAKALGTVNPDTAITNYMATNWSHGTDGLTPALNYTVTSSGAVSGTAEIVMPTTLLGVIGRTSLTIKVSSRVEFGAGDAEIALVMDNTASMGGAKLDSLRSAARGLVNTVKPGGAHDDRVKISLVPFARYVNGGLSNRSADWATVPADYTDTGTSCRMIQPVTSESNCRMQTSTCTNDGVSYECQQQVCDRTYGDPVEQCTDYTSNYSWSGCFGSREHPLNVTPLVDASHPVPGVLNATCPNELTRLTTSKSTIESKIDAMTATGDTYIPSGLIWGWRTLTSEAPFADGASVSSGTPVRKFLVLMTDGANTRSKTASQPEHNGVDKAAADALTAELCQNIKSANIKIFTIAFEVTDTATQTLLSNCSSGPPFYFTADNGAELTAAFEQIAQSVVAMRVSR